MFKEVGVAVKLTERVGAFAAAQIARVVGSVLEI